MKEIQTLKEKSIEEIITQFQTSLDGLTQKQAEERLKKYGLNKIKFFKIDLWEIIKRNTFNFFNILLFLAGILSFILKGPQIETFLIFFFLFLAISIAVFQDYRSNKLAEKLLSYFKNYAYVKRDNEWQKIDAEYLVPGDLIKVEAGYLIPADLKITKIEDALFNESILTGESEPVAKNISEIAFMGTTLIKGEIEGIVIATGSQSYFGSLAKSTIEISKETAYQKMMEDFAKKIGYLAIGLIFFLIFINFLKPQPAPINEVIVFSIVLAIAIVPEFLPAMTVLTLSLTGTRLAKKGLIIKRLSAIEDLGGIQVLCTDKTGTITTGELKLEKIIKNQINELEFVKFFLADYYFTKEITPYESAFLEKFALPDYSDFDLIEEYEFDPEKRIKRILIKQKEKNELIEIIKGAPEEVLKIFSANDWFKVFQKEDENGLRTLALGIKVFDQENKIKESLFLGLASFFDPIKPTADEAIKLAKMLNVEIKILTGDSLNVAKSVALKLGVINENEKVVLGEEIRNLTEDELEKIVKETKVFARVLPEDKLKIIQILQKEKFVGFLGEGINDAPALKIVNVGLVVDTATDVTKETADIILKEKDLNTIISGIYEGRKSLENIGKYIKHTMSDNFGNLMAVSFLGSILPFVPLTPLQVLLTNFLTDIPLIAFAHDNVSVKEIRKPVKISNFYLILLLLILGGSAALTNILAYLLVKNQSIDLIRTYIFYFTTLNGLTVSFSIRTKNWFFLSKPAKPFWITASLGIILTLVFIFVPYFQKIFHFAPISKELIYFSLILLLIFIVLTEVSKKLFYQKYPDVI